ncbi:shikimate kinase [Streptosporangium canum]|uniref:Shikimate kinase n=1 Tax=Streptosporangium canum TaxID=324952 RepID=A0A1I3ZTK1_9ACTN|nr:ATP-binding protein [Streptosporangium canum]SFK47021.1 shikimate kinase [Streptosporangium canum]
MIIWLNGTFGAGKTTTAKELTPLIQRARLFDPEQIGYMLGHVPDLPRLGDFQHWRPWRGLVVETIVQLLDYVGGVLVAPQTVLIEQYWKEIHTGLSKSGIPVHHFVLHTDQRTLTHRIETDTVETGARQWRLDHLADYHGALPWLTREAELVDTTEITPSQVARIIAGRVAQDPEASSVEQ